MNMLLLSYYHGAGMVGGLTHMIVGSIVNGLIFGLIFRLIAHLSLMQLVLLVAVVIGGAYMWARSRDQRRW
jgi:predicted lipid-binding transport protein (Tim44 family)